MTDFPLALLLVAVFFLAIAAARFFKTLDGGFWRAARTPTVVGLFAGVAILVCDRIVPGRVVIIGVILTAAALYVRLTGNESEPADGMLLGSILGCASAVVPLVAERAVLWLPSCILAGAVAGYGITFAARHVSDPLRQLLVDAVTGAGAVGAAAAPGLIARPAREVVIATVVAIPLLVVLTVFRQWSDLSHELRDEAAHGFIDEADVRPTAHPFLRIGSGGWKNRQAHREFVRLTNEIALRKRQQRHRSDETARIYQLEIIKLRMSIQEMARIDKLARSGQSSHSFEGDVRSDTMTGQRHEG